METLRSVPQKLCFWLGAAFLGVGLLGFVAPGAFGTHLSVAHNVIHLVSGVVAIAFGLTATPRAARGFAWTFGIAYGLLGVAGFLFGEPGVPATGHLMSDPFLLIVLPGMLEFGRNDHFLHLFLGGSFVASALAARVKPVLHYGAA